MIYLDHAATSPLRQPVWQAMQALVGEADYNPASVHSAGGRAAEALEKARAALAVAIGAPRSRVSFTGGGTQSDNLAVLGFARAHEGRGRILVSAIEHKAVLEAAARASVEGTEVRVLPVDSSGVVSPEALDEHLRSDRERPSLVSIMWANNETGVVQPIEDLLTVAHAHGALFHTDAVQALGKLPLSVEETPVDMLTVTAHKLGGPVGIGLLYRAECVALEPLSYGGSQEGGLWPGTQNPLGAAGFAEAARLATEELPESADRWRNMRNRLETRLRDAVPDLRVHAEDASDRLPHILSVGLPGRDQAVLLTALDLEGVSASAGSACSSGSHAGSHVLEAMGVSLEEPYAVLRMSFGAETEESEIDRATDVLSRVLGRIGGGAA